MVGPVLGHHLGQPGVLLGGGQPGQIDLGDRRGQLGRDELRWAVQALTGEPGTNRIVPA